ncbi:MAG TPA: YihY/virulence factor BrkB family protein [Vicinamibacterales bacterium]|nr:YihY/virulence factor BrkB family protein [Vicinamibacterales bacterium]
MVALDDCTSAVTAALERPDPGANRPPARAPGYVMDTGVVTESPPRGWVRTFARAGGRWLERNAFVHAGSLAFYTLFSLAPVVIVAVAVAGILFGEQAARGEVVTQIEGFLGADAARAVEGAVVRSRIEVSGILPLVAGAAVLLFGATTVFAQMQISLNRIWGVAARPQGAGWIRLVQTRLLSLTVVLGIGFILLVSLVVSVTLRAGVRYAAEWVPFPGLVMTGVETAVSLLVITLLFAVIYKVLPDVVIAWSDVWAGAATAAVLFTIGRHLIAAYLAYSAPGSAYGAAGSLVLLLMWVYYSSLILLFGAALAHARVVASGRNVVPRRPAVRVREQVVDE